MSVRHGPVPQRMIGKLRKVCRLVVRCRSFFKFQLPAIVHVNCHQRFAFELHMDAPDIMNLPDMTDQPFPFDGPDDLGPALQSFGLVGGHDSALGAGRALNPPALMAW